MPTALTLFKTVLRKLTTAEVDANFEALRDNVDKLGGYTASQTPGLNQIVVTNAAGNTVLPKNVVVPSDYAVMFGDTAYNSAILGSATAKRMQFWINGAEAVRLDSACNILAGLTSGSCHTFVKNNPGNYAVSIDNSAVSNPYTMRLGMSGVTGGSGAYFLVCADNGNRLLVLGNGNVQNALNSYGAFSDMKLKENVTPAPSYWEKFKQYAFINYNLIADPTKKKLLGLGAQEAEKVSPSIVEETPDMAERQVVVDGVPQYEQKQAVGPDGAPLFRLEPQLVSQPKKTETGAQLFAPGPESDTFIQVMEEVEISVPVPIMVDDLDRPIMESYATGEVTKGIKYSVVTLQAECVLQEAQTRIEDLEVARQADRTLIEDLQRRLLLLEQPVV